MKRFYLQAAVAARGDSFAIELDGREVKTPEKRPTLIPTKELAEAICGEWNGQEDKVRPETMPLTKLLNTAIDRVQTRRAALIEELVQYAGTDLLCYRTAYPEDLARLQAQIWQPLLDWVQQSHAATLKITNGIQHVEQAPEDMARIGNFLDGQDSFTLAAFYNITTLCGSVAIGLNILGRNIDCDGAWEAAHLDENYQIAQWGMDDEALIRQENMRADLEAAVCFLKLIML